MYEKPLAVKPLVFLYGTCICGKLFMVFEFQMSAHSMISYFAKVRDFYKLFKTLQCPFLFSEMHKQTRSG